jgi:hypothetical protein
VDRVPKMMAASIAARLDAGRALGHRRHVA